MRQLSHWAQGLAVAAALTVLPQLASAVPVTFNFTTGSVTVSVTTGITTLLVVPSVPLTGDHVTFDDAVPELSDIVIEVLSAGPYTLSTAYAGYDTVKVTGVQLSPAPGYTGPAVLQASGPPVDNYAYTGGPLKVTGTLNISDSTLSNPTNIAAFNIPNPSASGTLFVNTITGNISLTGVTIAVVPPPSGSGEPFPLVIKGDFFFQGLVPEPGTALLLGAGLLGLVAAGRRIRG